MFASTPSSKALISCKAFILDSKHASQHVADERRIVCEMVRSNSVGHRLSHLACWVVAPQGRLLVALQHASGATGVRVVQHLSHCWALAHDHGPHETKISESCESFCLACTAGVQ